MSFELRSRKSKKSKKNKMNLCLMIERQVAEALWRDYATKHEHDE